jgi:hypothetical protein
MTVPVKVVKPRSKKSGSKLEDDLIKLVKDCGIPEPDLQTTICRDSVGRLWQYDISWSRYKVTVEVQGGIWRRKGAHNTGPAIMRDCEKGNEAQMMGWICLHVTKEHIKDGQAVSWIIRALLSRGWVQSNNGWEKNIDGQIQL